MDGGLQQYVLDLSIPHTVSDLPEDGEVMNILKDNLEPGTYVASTQGNSTSGRVVQREETCVQVQYVADDATTSVVQMTHIEFFDMRLRWLLSETALTVEPSEAEKLRNALRRDNIVIFDTTHGTNRFGFKLGLFSTVGSDLKNKVIAMSLVRCEDHESFAWVFESFMDAFKFPPKVACLNEKNVIVLHESCL